jgi:hypothetical protein
VAGSCEYGSSIKVAEFLDQLSGCQLHGVIWLVNWLFRYSGFGFN